MTLPPLSFSTGPEVAGGATGGRAGVTLGNYSEGINTTHLLLMGLGAILVMKWLK